MSKHYDYIITGAGCAGSSLLMRMMKEPFFQDKQILVIDQSPKTANDRTWCFWEKQAGLFESIVHHAWTKLDFFSNQYSDTLLITPYQYKMIRGIDLYESVSELAAQHSNIEWRYEKVNAIKSDSDFASVETVSNTYTCDYVFNSILFIAISANPLKEGRYLLLQHFKGWLIKTREPVFDPSRATFMDFRVGQEHGTSFVYLMPTSPTTALVEYTLFTEELLPKETYEKALRDYIVSSLHVTDYEVTHEESGVIPMTNLSFPLQEGRIVYTGIAGGQAKGSSGYAFQFIQKRTQQIVDALVKKGTLSLHKRLKDKKFHLYDSVLLNILHNRRMKGDEIFARIFKHNPPDQVLRFLDNESSLYEDFKIMRSVPAAVFLPAALKELCS
ncbi:MAG: lycopene cyclase family protein [Bacteroidota bacterium]